RARSSRSPSRRFEQLDGVARGIVEQDLPAAVAHDDLVPESDARRPQFLDFAAQIVDLELDAVPAARLGLASIGHRLACAAAAARRAQQQAERAVREHREARAGVELDAEAEAGAVERDR